MSTLLGALHVHPPLSAADFNALPQIPELGMSLGKDGKTIDLKPHWKSSTELELVELVRELRASERKVYASAFFDGRDQWAQDWVVIDDEVWVDTYEPHKVPFAPKPWVLSEDRRNVFPRHVAAKDLTAFQRATFSVMRFAADLDRPIAELDAALTELAKEIKTGELAAALRTEFAWIALHDMELNRSPNQWSWRVNAGLRGALAIHLVLGIVADRCTDLGIDVHQFDDRQRREAVEPIKAILALAKRREMEQHAEQLTMWLGEATGEDPDLESFDY
jgi:hypothetical protein